MKSFEEKKNEYFVKLQVDSDIVVRLVEDNNKSEEGKKTLKLLFNPQNEKELLAAETIYTMYHNFTLLLDKLADDEIKEIPAKDNFGLNHYVEILKKLRTGSKPEELNYNSVSPDYAGKVIYDYIVAMALDPEESTSYMAKKAGYNLDDIIDQEKFELDLETATKMVGSYNNKSMSLEEATIEDVEFGKKVALAFRKAFEDGIKEEKDKTKKRIL